MDNKTSKIIDIVLFPSTIFNTNSPVNEIPTFFRIRDSMFLLVKSPIIKAIIIAAYISIFILIPLSIYRFFIYQIVLIHEKPAIHGMEWMASSFDYWNSSSILSLTFVKI